MDARHLRLVRVAFGLSCLIPDTDQTIDELLGDVTFHHQLHPKHPHDCACLDVIVNKIRAAIYRQMPGGRLDEDLKGKYRFRHVLRDATRSL